MESGLSIKERQEYLKDNSFIIKDGEDKIFAKGSIHSNLMCDIQEKDILIFLKLRNYKPFPNPNYEVCDEHDIHFKFYYKAHKLEWSCYIMRINR